ncbi:MAG: NFACT family protein, partial [Anaeroplasma sp.]
RIHLTKKSNDSITLPKSFTMLLRKHIEGYFIEEISTYNCDRIIYFTLTGYNELHDLNKKYLICEIMGRYSNLILTNENFLIIDSLKHDGVGEYNRTILPNAIYEFPVTNKLNPLNYSLDELITIFNEKKPQTPKDVINIFEGVSLNLAYPIFMCDKHAEKFYELIHTNNKPSTFINYNNKKDFYYNSFNNEIIKEYSSLSTLLDDYYYQADLNAKIKHKTNDLLSFVNKQIDKYTKKIEKLKLELNDTKMADNYRLYGELLLSHPNLKEKCDYLIINNYYTNEDIKIPLDKKYSILDNSNRYFKKYQKLKSSVTFINEQIDISNTEIEYFKILKFQLSNCSINEALEIQDELINNKYIFNKQLSQKKKNKPKILTYEVNNLLIFVGKNNIQNEYITHKLAKPNNYWFHIKDGAGSHVVVNSETELSEEIIRIAANLAAYHSTYKDSSSVAVDYTKIRNIKKIPGKKNCFVSYTHQKTIYIDPSEEIINELKVKA